jgi:nucleoid-associated protein YgaU
MGREKRILLGLLGLLAGVFVGLLSKKLLVPRPPAGAGPDVDVRTAFGEPTQLVEPPRRSLRAADFAAAPPLVAENAPERMPFQTESAGFGADVAYAADTDLRSAAAFVNEADAPVRFAPAAIEPVSLEPAAIEPPLFEPAPFEPSGELRPLAPAATSVAPPVTASPAAGGATPASFATPPGILEAGSRGILEAGSRGILEAGSRGMMTAGGPGVHVAQPGDSWWSIAESVYGDGRLYRAVFAWNRAVDPRVTLAVGTRLELPPLDKLRAAWPALVPSAP